MSRITARCRLVDFTNGDGAMRPSGEGEDAFEEADITDDEG
jgi:hypothetical protein